MSVSTYLTVLSRSDCFIQGELGGVGGVGVTISSVVVKDVGPNSVFVKGYIARNKDWLGLLVDL